MTLTEATKPADPDAEQSLRPTDPQPENHQTEQPNMRPLGARPKIPSKRWNLPRLPGKPQALNKGLPNTTSLRYTIKDFIVTEENDVLDLYHK